MTCTGVEEEQEFYLTLLQLDSVTGRPKVTPITNDLKLQSDSYNETPYIPDDY